MGGVADVVSQAFDYTPEGILLSGNIPGVTNKGGGGGGGGAKPAPYVMPVIGQRTLGQGQVNPFFAQWLSSRNTQTPMSQIPYWQTARPMAAMPQQFQQQMQPMRPQIPVQQMGMFGQFNPYMPRR